MFLVISGKRAVALFLAILIPVLGFFVSAGEEKTEEDGILIPIIMYHSILNDSKRTGKYVVSPKTLEADMQYLQEKGYQTVFMRDVIDYVYEDKALPEKPVVLTFDDGYYNNMTYLLPLLEQYRMKAVISVVGSFSEQFSQKDDHNPNYSHLTWADIKELSESGRIEIANHTYQMHTTSERKGCAIKKGEKADRYQAELFLDLEKLQRELVEKSGVPAPVTFTYPFGFICKESQEVVEQCGFLASLSCYEKVSCITKNKGSLYQLGRFNRPEGISTEKFMKKLRLD